MKKYIFLLSFCCSMSCLYAQEDTCNLTIEKAKIILYKESPFVDQATLVTLLEPCASQGHAQALNYLGLVYLNGIGTAVNHTKAYQYISSAANKGYVQAQYNLGRLYKYGVGCDINFIKAIEWFEIATANGNQRAAYTLGYMNFKGFGVPQDYQKAVAWFNKSTDPMARHFLGLCYYLGYGVNANTTRALEILLSNPIINSKTLVTYIEKEQKSQIKTEVSKALETTTTPTPISQDLVASTQEELQYYPEDTLELNTISGKWVGKLIQHDWSGKHIQRVLPIKMAFNIDKQSNKVNITTKLEDQEISAHAIWQDETLFFENIEDTFSLTRLYPDNPKNLTSNYNLLSTSLQKYTYQEHSYLIGSLDTYIPEWTEYGSPLSLILVPEGAESTLSDETLLALAAQEDQFIKLYPVPFKDKLTVQYQLEQESPVYVELISLNGTNKIMILPTKVQQAGDYTYTIPVESTLPQGLYVVRLIAGEQLHTRMIIKEN